MTLQDSETKLVISSPREAIETLAHLPSKKVLDQISTLEFHPDVTCFSKQPVKTLLQIACQCQHLSKWYWNANQVEPLSFQEEEEEGWDWKQVEWKQLKAFELSGNMSSVKVDFVDSLLGKMKGLEHLTLDVVFEEQELTLDQLALTISPCPTISTLIYSLRQSPPQRIVQDLLRYCSKSLEHLTLHIDIGWFDEDPQVGVLVQPLTPLLQTCPITHLSLLGNYFDSTASILFEHLDHITSLTLPYVSIPCLPVTSSSTCPNLKVCTINLIETTEGGAFDQDTMDHLVETIKSSNFFNASLAVIELGVNDGYNHEDVEVMERVEESTRSLRKLAQEQKIAVIVNTN